MSSTHVLVIEDEPMVADAVAKILAGEGLAVTTVDRASEGLQKLEKGRFGMVFCDIMLPDLDGFGFLEAMAERDVQAPVVMMTGYSTVENAVRSLSMGAVDYIPKPFTVDELLASYRRGLRASRLLEQAEQPGLGRRTHLGFVPCPDDYYRLGYCSWAHLEDEGTARIGVSDLFLKSVGEVERFELHGPGDELAQGVPCATVCVGASEHEILCPLSGRILETNKTAVSEPSLVEKDPFFKGWLYQILPSSLENNLRWLRL